MFWNNKLFDSRRAYWHWKFSAKGIGFGFSARFFNCLAKVI